MTARLAFRVRQLCLISHFSAVFAVAVAVAAIVVLAPSAGAQPADGTQPADEAEQPPDPEAELVKDVTQGALRIVAPGAGIVECPLVHTDVRAEISGFLARVHVTQTFRNPKDERIEAVYVFPLPHQSAIDDMTMRIGERRIVGQIKRRAEARRIYEQALYAGQTAALLEQERPNIFTQSVGNIPPGEEVRVEISYVDVLKYDVGTYEFSFPMVVGPRFNPGTPSPPGPLNRELAGHAVPGGAATTQVPDGDRINPPILRPGHRTGHDISLTVHLDAGVPVEAMEVKSHESSVERPDNRHALVKLNEMDSIPNKDFVLRYKVTGEKPAMALLAHRTPADPDAKRPDRDAGYFMLMVQPAEDERLQKSPPREIVFLMDVSGSMRGAPTAKAVQTMQHMLTLCREGVDTVQVVTFANQANKLFPAPVPVNRQNIDRATQFAGAIRAGGGTQMLQGVKLAMDEPIDPERVRIIIMLTDGYIGNEAAIIEHVGRAAGDQIRFWCVGIGASPNMFLIDGVARQGGGMGQQLNLNDDSLALATEVITRIQRAQLADVEIDWGGLNVFDTYPAKIPELWAGRPVILFGRYLASPGPFAIAVKGRVEGEPAEWPLTVELPADEPQHDVLAPTWARQKIEDLMHQAYYGDSPAVAEAVTALALDYRLMSQYTSFVAVDDSQPAAEGPVAPPYRMMVPVPLPAGTRWDGFFGPEQPLAGERLNLAMYQSLGIERLGEMQAGRVPALRQLSRAARPAATPMFAIDSAAPANSQQYGLARGQSTSGFGGGGFGGGGLSARGGFDRAAFGGAAQSGGRGGRRGRAIAQPAANRSLQLLDRAVARSSPVSGPVVVNGFTEFDAYWAEGNGREADQPAETPDPAAAIFVWDQNEADVADVETIASTALEAAAKALEAKDTATARREFERAIYFAEVQANRQGGRANTIAAQAMEQLERLRREVVAEWTNSTPKLATRLDLMLRDVSVEEAIARIAQAADVPINVTPGSIADAALLVDDHRVHYLDLRRATVADALEWILTPARLTWQLDGENVTVTSRRRQPGLSCWVYDVADMALPRHSELGDPADQAAYMANAQKACDAFLAAVRERMNASRAVPGPDENVQWFAPGQLLIVGDAATQAKAAAFFAELADPSPTRGGARGGASELHTLARARLADRQEARAKSDTARAQYRALVALDAYGWPLLSAAAAGRLDLEALTELEIAWKSLDRSKVPDELQFVLLRTAWIVTEVDRVLPYDNQLAELTAVVRADMVELTESAVQSLAAAPAESLSQQQLLAATYAALARRDDVEFSRGAYDAITAATAEPNAWLTRLVVPALFRRGGEGVVPAELRELVRDGDVRGDDAVVLAALACRFAGRETWAAFRAEAADLLGRQPLAGEVVVFVHYLSAKPLPLVASESLFSQRMTRPKSR